MPTTVAALLRLSFMRNSLGGDSRLGWITSTGNSPRLVFRPAYFKVTLANTENGLVLLGPEDGPSCPIWLARPCFREPMKQGESETSSLRRKSRPEIYMRWGLLDAFDRSPFRAILRRFDAGGSHEARDTIRTPARRALQILIEVEAKHLAQCEHPETCEMLRKLREEISELRSQHKKGRFKCRDFLHRIQTGKTYVP